MLQWKALALLLKKQQVVNGVRGPGFFILPFTVQEYPCLLARGKSEREAEELVDTVDRERADFIEKHFKVERPDRAIYHSMMNTTIGDEAVVHMILELNETYRARATA